MDGQGSERAVCTVCTMGKQYARDEGKMYARDRRVEMYARVKAGRKAEVGATKARDSETVLGQNGKAVR